MDVIQRSVVAPSIEIVMDRAAWGKILRDVTLLAARSKDVHKAIHDLADVDRPFVAAGFGRRDQRFNFGPLLGRQIMSVAQSATVVSETGLICPPMES